MKKRIALVLTLLCMVGLSGCSRGQTHTIEIIIPAGSTEAFVFSDEEISPLKDTLTISAGAGITSTDVILRPVEVKEKTEYEPAPLSQKTSVQMDVEKNAWFQIGVAIQNPSDKNMTVAITVEDVYVRIE